MLHFIFLVHDDELESRRGEYEYVKRMAAFFKSWMQDSFGVDYAVKCDQMIVERTHVLTKPRIEALLRDHRQRGESTWHFYLANFRPLWTDSLSEGYHSENMCMVMWSRPNPDSDALFLAEKNCTAVSYEIAHELLRQMGRRLSINIVNDAWARHYSGEQKFSAYGADHKPTDGVPEFLTIDPQGLNKIS